MFMYKNGVCQGLAFEDVYGGMYYPSVSLYKAATVRQELTASKLMYYRHGS